MERAALVVDPNRSRRLALCKAFTAKGLAYVQAPSVFQAIATLGRAPFLALVAAETRPAALRGLCRLARKRHPAVHLVVLLKPGSRAADVQEAVGLNVECLPRDTPAPAVVERVLALLKAPAPLDLEPMLTALVQLDVEAALADEKAHPGEEETVLMEGTLEGETGSALLMGLFAQQVTGKLVLQDGDAAGSIYFVDGEPTLAVASNDAWWASLVLANAVKGPRPPVSEGRLLPTLARAGQWDEAAAAKCAQNLLKERVRKLVAQRSGTWRFLEVPDARTLPLQSRINPFGVMLEHHRRALPPDRLHAVGNEIQGRYVHPGSALKLAASRVAGFVKGADVSTLVTGDTTVGQLCEAIHLDLIMGALVVTTLADAQLITLQDKPRAPDETHLDLDFQVRNDDDIEL